MKVKQRQVFQFSSKPNLQYCVLLCAVCFGGTGKSIERNVILYQIKIKEKEKRKKMQAKFFRKSQQSAPSKPKFSVVTLACKNNRNIHAHETILVAISHIQDVF